MSDATTIRPIRNRLVVQPDAESLITESGLHLPDSQESLGEKPTVGTIIAAGPEADPSLVRGTRAVFSAYGGVDVVIDDVPYRIFTDDMVLTVLA